MTFLQNSSLVRLFVARLQVPNFKRFENGKLKKKIKENNKKESKIMQEKTERLLTNDD